LPIFSVFWKSDQVNLDHTQFIGPDVYVVPSLLEKWFIRTSGVNIGVG
jgi:hypothetical protein